MKDYHSFDRTNEERFAEEEMSEIRRKFDSASKQYEYLKGKHDESYSVTFIGFFLLFGGLIIGSFIKDSYAPLILFIIGSSLGIGSVINQFRNLSKRKNHLFQMRMILLNQDLT